MTYFHDAEFTLPGGSVVKEKGRLYKNINKDGTCSSYTYECKYSCNGVERVETGLTFTDPLWANASEEDINKAMTRKLKK